MPALAFGLVPLLAYRPFLDPLPVWNYPYLLALPLCIAIAVVWKSVKCHRMSEVPREAGIVLLWILGGFAAAAAVLTGLVFWANR